MTTVFAGDLALADRHEAAGIVTLTFEPRDAFAAVGAGQFLIAASNRPGAPPLGRPVSILSAEPLTIAFALIGAGTAALAETAPGETIHVVGPLGRPFAAMPDDTLLVTDATHFGTLLALGAERRAEGHPLAILYVTRPPGPAGPVSTQEQDALLIQMLAPHAAGLRAVSACALEAALTRSDAGAIVAGASDAVMAIVQRVAGDRGLAGQAALQAVMGCGIGVCQSCVRPMRDGSAALVCEGPVFALDRPVFAADARDAA